MLPNWFFVLQRTPSLPSPNWNLPTCCRNKLITWTYWLSLGGAKCVLAGNLDFSFLFSPFFVLFCVYVKIFIHCWRLVKYQKNSVSNSFLKANFLVFEKTYDWKTFLLKMLDVLLLSDWYCTFTGTGFISSQIPLCSWTHTQSFPAAPSWNGLSKMPCTTLYNHCPF